jgi:hypothetical protein
MTPATPTVAPSSGSAATALLHQLYVTHCLYDEGLSREAGFGVRAGSTRDPLLLRFALEYPPYELPAGVEAGDGAPRRLALVRVPGGRSALVHSVPLPRDDRGRANNFFSHVLFADAIPPQDALSAWASPGWAVDCRADGDKDIRPAPEIPWGVRVSDRALTAFLQEPVPPADPALATLTCPRRLADDAKRRRRLLVLALRGCLLALQAGAAAPRGRFYLLAEPGLVALLLYGAARLLPPALVRGLTFSTYENAQTALRSYRHAQVVGTWLADPARGLDDEFFGQRGYALDTFSDRASPDMETDPEPALDEWAELAARGEWATIDRLHALLGPAATSVVAYKDGAQLARLVRRVASGRAGVEDLVALKSSPWGPAVLAEHHEQVWPLVRDACLSEPRVREEFADLIRDNLPDLERRAAALLREQPPGAWQPYWRVVWSVLQAHPVEVREALERILPEPPYLPQLCFSVLTELQTLRLSAADPRVPLHALLKTFGTQELAQFAQSSLPREWFVWALCYALLRPDTRDEAARYLHEGDEDLVRVFWQQFRLLRDAAQRRAILIGLVTTAGDRGPLFLGRLLACGSGLRPDTLAWLLGALGAWKREWADFWGRDDHLGQLLQGVRAFGDEGGTVWERFCADLDRGVLPPGDPYQHTLLMNLTAVAARPGPPLPQAAAQAIADWSLLRDHFEKASAVPPQDRAAVIDACNRRRLDPMDELTAYFARYVQPRPPRDELLDDFAGFYHSFSPEPREYPDHGARLVGWLELASGCPDAEKKETYQRYYLHRFVPEEFRRRLAEETHRAGKLLPVVYETVDRPPEMAAEEQEAAPPAAGADLTYQLTGVTLPEGEATLPPRGLWRRLPWLACALQGGVVAALVFGLYKPPTPRSPSLPALIAFVPLALALADSLALQSVGLAIRLRGAGGQLRRGLAKELLAGTLLALVCGLASAGAALALGTAMRLAFAVAAAVAAGAVVAAVVGFALAVLFGGGRVAAGPLARALAGAGALLLYLFVTRAFGV